MGQVLGSLGFRDISSCVSVCLTRSDAYLDIQMHKRARTYMQGRVDRLDFTLGPKP